MAEFSSPMPLEPRVCAVIPVYDHGATVGAVVAGLRDCGLPCIVVDDGSGPECARILDQLALHEPGVTLLRRATNHGKGAAVACGLRGARAAGFTHALQIDADGQHAIADVPAFMAATRAEPQAIICGRPVFDHTIPRARLYGRRFTRLWVNINTLSTGIPDAMCGFRVYPVRFTDDLLRAQPAGRRMDFDIGVLVRLSWRGAPMHWIDTQVIYPPGGVSHFRLLRDNVLISAMHAKLFFGMLLRLPVLLWRKIR